MDKMILLENNVYCKRRILESALSTAKKTTHFARQLIPAVFKPAAILKSMLKGQSPRVTKSDNPSVQVDCLNGVAKDAIIGYQYICMCDIECMCLTSTAGSNDSDNPLAGRHQGKHIVRQCFVGILFFSFRLYKFGASTDEQSVLSLMR